MAWNEPGGGNGKDPWSNKGNDQGPPDIDEVVKNLQDKMGGLFGRGNGGDGGGAGDGGKGGGLVIVVIAVLIVGMLLVNAFYVVGPAERGVVQRFGAYSSVTEPGPHLMLPLVDKVTKVNVDQVDKFTHRAEMLTKDENIVDLTLTVQFRIQDAVDFMFQDADPGDTIHGAMESALRQVIGRSNLDEIITENRSGIADSVKSGTQELLNLYKTGLLVTSINIQDANPPEQVKAAFDDATRAREDKERVQNQAEAYANDIVPRARGAASRQIEDAKAYKAKVIAEAEGESARFLALLREYQKAPAVTRERLYLETVQEVLAQNGKVMLDTGKGNNLTYLPLDKLMEQRVKPKVESAMPTSALRSSGNQQQPTSGLRSGTGREGRDFSDRRGR